MTSDSEDDEHMPKRMRAPPVKPPSLSRKVRFREMRGVKEEAGDVQTARRYDRDDEEERVDGTFGDT